MTEHTPPLLTENLRTTIPNLYETEKQADPIVHAKLFTPWTNWTWYVTEFDGVDRCFGLVTGHETELGYFSLGEMQEIEGPGGLRIERDIHFKPIPLSEVQAALNKLHSPDPGPTPA